MRKVIFLGILFILLFPVMATTVQSTELNIVKGTWKTKTVEYHGTFRVFTNRKIIIGKIYLGSHLAFMVGNIVEGTNYYKGSVIYGNYKSDVEGFFTITDKTFISTFSAKVLWFKIDGTMKGEIK